MWKKIKVAKITKAYRGQDYWPFKIQTMDN
jgi:hypothetical protein